MKTPIILRADDGLSWWNDADWLRSSIEPQDIKDGIYTAWDSAGQALALTREITREKWSLFGRARLITEPEYGIFETGRHEPHVLHAVIASHVTDVWNYQGDIPADLPSIVFLLCRLQSGER